MRHAAAIAKVLFPPTMALPAVGGVLVLPASLAVTSLVTQGLAALFAVALTAVVPDTHLERPATHKALDLDEIDRARIRQWQRPVGLDKPREAWEALTSRCRASDSTRRLPGRSGVSGRALPTHRREHIPPPVPHPAPPARITASRGSVSWGRSATLARGLHTRGMFEGRSPPHYPRRRLLKPPTAASPSRLRKEMPLRLIYVNHVNHRVDTRRVATNRAETNRMSTSAPAESERAPRGPAA